MSEEVTEYIFKIIKEKINIGMYIEPERFKYTRYIIGMINNLEMNEEVITDVVYDRIVKEFLSYIKLG